MEFYLEISKSLLQKVWYLPCVAAITCVIYYFRSTHKIDQPKIAAKTNTWWLLFIGFLVFLVFSAAYWMFGDNAAHGFSDDIAHTLQTYLSSSLRGDSINWTNGLAGGMDRWPLPNSYPYALGRIYAVLIHKPYQLYLLVMMINVVCVFIFSWKIQVEMLQMRPWAAYIGAVIATIIEGYWTGGYPDAHVSQGHGFTVIIVGIYWLSRFSAHSRFWLVAVIVGALMAVGSWTPFHNLPPLLITVALWGSIFWGRGAWRKVLIANVLIVVVLMLLLFPYFLAIKLLFSTTGRMAVFRPSVDLSNAYPRAQIIILVIMFIGGSFFNIYRQKIVRQVLFLFLGVSLLPLIAYGLEISKIAPFFRWDLLYTGNEAWHWIAIVFFMDKIQQEIQGRWLVAGIGIKVLVISLAWTVILFAWMNSFWLDLITSYPEGNWKSYTDSSVSAILKKIEPGPVRVVGIGATHDTHFWGEYQGIEPFLVYTPFIDQRKTFFWWYSAMYTIAHGHYTAAWLSIPIPILGPQHDYSFPLPLSALVNLDGLRVANVHWIVSHHPLYPMPDLDMVVGQEGQAACSPSSWLQTQVNFRSLGRFWVDVNCIVKDYAYQRPLYVYHLKGALPRVYLASTILPWLHGQPPILTQPELKMAAQGAAFIDLNQWNLYQTQSSSGNVELTDYHSDYMRMDLHIKQDSLVVVSTTLNKYWRILVDGRKVSGFDVNGFQDGFWVGPGQTQAELIYCPPYRPAQDPHCSGKVL